MTAIPIATEAQARDAAHEALDAGHIEAAMEIVSALLDHTWEDPMPDMPRYDCDDLPVDGWADYRKTTTTRMAPIEGPCVVITQEGPYTLPTGWKGQLALDSQGWPYPVAAEVFAETYEPVSDE